MLYRVISSGQWMAGIRVINGRVHTTSPMLAHLMGLKFEDVLKHCHKKGWVIVATEKK